MKSDKMRPFGITWRIALLAWSITLVTVSIFVLAIIPEQKRTFVENLESKGNGIAVSICHVVAGAVVNEDYSDLVEHCLQVLKGDKSIEYLVITKNNGESWIHDKSGWRYKQLSAEWRPKQREPSSGIGVVSEFNRRVFHHSQPFDYSGIQWGWVHVGLSLETYDRSVATMHRRTGILALTCIVVSLMASCLYARLLVRPIRTLQSVVRRIARGDLSARAAIHTGDEIESLADSFNAMTGTLLQRDKILASVQFASQQFLAATDWRTVTDEVLTHIGQAADICRACIFENHPEPNGGLLPTARFQYVAARATLLETPPRQNFQWNGAAMEAWAKSLKEGKVISAVVRDLGPAAQALFVPQKIQSLILVPIRIEGAWWGHLEFDDCSRERAWTVAEVDSLRALADMVGAAIARQRVQDALLEAKQTLEQRVTERTQELQEQVMAKEKAQPNWRKRRRTRRDLARGGNGGSGHRRAPQRRQRAQQRQRIDHPHPRQIATIRDFKPGQGRRDAAKHESGHRRAFLTADPKGKMVPGLHGQLATTGKGASRPAKEHDQLARNVEHIKEIVAMQQNYARVSGFLEPDRRARTGG